MATKNFYVHDGLKVKGNSLLNGSTFSDSASAKLHVKTAANGASANLSNVNGLIIENSGSSNSNYALKLATGAGNILNVTNSGRVGIGEISPDVQLHVKSASTTFAQVRVEAAADGHDSSVAYSQAGSIKGISGYDDSTNTVAIKYGTFGGSGIDIDSSGNVGIGITDPTSLLHIDTGANSAANFRLGANRTVANAAVGQLIGDWNGTVVAKIALKTGDDTTNKDDGEIAFEVAAAGTTAEAMRIQNDGNVGIGTTSPTRALTVGSTCCTTGNIINLTSSTSGYVQLAFGDSDDDNRSQILYDNNTDNLTFQTGGGTGFDNGKDRLVIDNTGNVGVGTTDPGKTLHVYTSDDIISKFSSSDAGGRILINDSTTNAYINAASGVASIGQINGLNNSNVNILSSGFVGIGTTGPDRPLHVNGGSLNFVAEFESTDDKASILIQDDDTLNYIHSQNGYLSLGGQNALNASNLNINSSNGDVGIGSTGPTAKLHVQGDTGLKVHATTPTSDAHYIRLRHDNSTGTLDANRGDLKFAAQNNVYTLNDFGVGTSTPNEKLTVSGNVSASGVVYADTFCANSGSCATIDFNDNLDVDGYITATQDISSQGCFYTSSGSNVALLANNYLRSCASGTFYFDHATVGQSFQFRTSNSSALDTAAMTITSAGNVGIGIATPDFPLEVAGAIGIDDKIYHNGDHNTYIGFDADSIALRTGGTDRLVINNSGATFSNDVTVCGTATFHGSLDLQDNDKLLLGSGNDLEIYHNGSDSYISDVGTGHLILATNSGFLVKSSTEKLIEGYPNGAVSLYYDNSKKLETTSTGVCITDDVQIAGNLIVQGTCSTLNTTVTATSAMCIHNAGTGPALQLNQTGSQPIVDLQDDGTSAFYIEDGGNVGIGTNNPAQKLHVCAAAAVCAQVQSNSNHAAVEIISPESTYSPYLRFKDNCGERYVAYSDTDHKLHFRPSGTSTASEWITFSQNGGLGVGTSTPAARLEVKNTASSGGTFKFSDGSSRTLMDLGGGILSWNAGTVFGAGSWAGTADHEFRTLGTSRDAVYIGGPTSGSNHALYVDGMCSYFGGSVGIGTTTPERKLHVFKGESGGQTSNSDSSLVLENSSHTYLQFLTPSTVESGLLFGDGNNDVGALVYDHADDEMRFIVNAAVKTVIDSSGRVGIGTTDVRSKLFIAGGGIMLDYGNGGSTDGAALRINSNSNEAFIQSNAYYSSAVKHARAGASSRIQFKLDATNGGDITFSTAPSAAADANMSQTERMTIKQGGNVGIGTTAPNANLMVGAGTRNAGTAVQQQAGYFSGTKSAFAGSGNKGLWQNQLHIADDSALAAGIGGAITFGATQDNTNGTYLASIEGSRDNACSGEYGASMIFRTRTNGSAVMGAHMVIASDGNVGIGTTDPGAKLDIHTGTNTNGILIREDTDDSITHNLYIDGDDDGVMLMYSNGQSGKVQLHTAGCTFFNGGNVGIGTGSACSKLHVYGSGEQNLIVGSSNGGRTLITLDGAGNGDGAGGDYAYLSHNADGAFDIKNLQNNSIRLATGSSGTTRMTITSAGDVGIGDSSPVVGLSLYGDGNKSRIKLANTSGHQVNIGLWDNSNYRIEGDANRPILITSYDTDGGVRIGASGSADMTVVGGEVGIGTTDPDSKLHVVNNDFVLFENTTASANSLLKLKTASRTWQMSVREADLSGALTFRNETAGTDDLVINTSGNVGIGTTDPSYPLDVVGYVNSSIGYRAGNYTIFNESGNETSLGNTAYYGVSFKTNNAVRMKIANDGNVGIGTATPATKLTVYNSSGNVLTLLGQSAANVFNVGATGVTQITGATGSTVLQVTNSGSGDYMAIGSCALLVKKDGDVGIGVSPSTRLHVSNPAVGQSGSAVTSITTTQATDLGVKLSFTGGANSDGNIIGGIALGNGGEEFAGLYAIDGGSSAATDLAFFVGDTNGINEAVHIDSGGTVQINSPASSGTRSLTVKLTDNTSGAAVFEQSSNEYLRINTTNGSEKIILGDNGTNPKINFNGEYDFPTADGSAGQVLTTDGNGALSFSSAGSGTISGSGTDNYIPRFNGTTALENSAIYDNGSNRISLGTVCTAPWQALHIQSESSTFTGGFAYNMAINSSTCWNCGFGGGILFGGAYNSSNTITTLAGLWTTRTNAADGCYGGSVNIGGRQHGTSTIDPVLTVTDAKVGIGTTQPNGMLEISRSQTTSAFSNNFLKLRPSTTTNNTGLTTISLGTSTVDDYGYSISGWRACTDGSPFLRIKRHCNSADGVDVMVMDNSGNIGIGITQPAFSSGGGGVEIERATATLRLQHPGSHASEIYQNTSALSIADLSSGTIRFLVANSECARLNATGLGIKTTNPSTELHVAGRGTFANNGCNIILKNTWSSGNHDILFAGGSISTGGANNTAARIRSLATAPGGAATGDLLFTVNCGDTFVDALYIQEDGKVGIGNASPGSNLYVGSGTQATSNMPGISIGNGTGTYSFFSASDQTKQFIAGVDHTISYTKSGNLSNHDHAIITNNTHRIYIEAGGDVGIGTTNPGHQLHLYGADAEFEIQRTGSYADTINFGMPSGVPTIVGGTDLALGGNGTWSEAVRIKSTGKVGIGTTNPGKHLTVIGEAKIDTSADNAPALCVSRNAGVSSVSATGAILTNTAVYINGNEDTGSDALRIGSMNNGSGDYFIDASNYNATAAYDILLNPFVGNVGIGETTALGKLHTKDGDVIIEQGDLYIASSSGAEGGEGGGGTGTPSLRFGESEGTSVKTWGMGWGYNGDGESGDCNRLYTITSAGTSADGHLTIQYGGNVGIGTTRPGCRLDVFNGAVRISSSGETKLHFRETVATDTYADRWTIGNDDAINNGFVISCGGNFDTPRLVVLDTGNVGVGTTDPNAKLDIRGTATDGQELLRIQSSGNVTDGGYHWMTSEMATGQTTDANIIHLIGRAECSKNSGYFGFNYQADGADSNFLTLGGYAANNLLNITMGGDVGIATTQPNVKLHVSGGDVRIGNGNKVYLYESNDVNYLAYNRWEVNTSTALAINNAGTGGFQVQDSGTAVLFVGTDSTYGGRVGIGTTQPQGQLHLHSSASSVQRLIIANCNSNLTPQQRIEFWENAATSTSTNANAAIEYDGGTTYQSSDGTLLIKGYGASADLPIAGFNRNGNVYLGMSGNGYVGIGTTNPLTDLHVNGSMGMYTSATQRLCIRSDGDRNYFEGKSGNGHRITTTGGAQIEICNGGNVGIGLTNPYNLLHVNGNARINSLIVGNSGVSNTPTACLHIKSSGTAASLRIEDSDSSNQVYDFLVDQGVGFKLIDKGTGSSTNTRLAIDTSGNVGIGTDSPNSKTDIVTGSRSCAFSSSDGTTWHDLIVRNPDSTQNAAVGLAFELNGTYHTNAGTGIAAVKEVGNGDYGAGLAFVTRPQSAAAVERVRIMSTGAVGIGTTCPGASNSGKLFVGTPNTTGSAAIAQFGGFIRTDSILTHDSTHGIRPNTTCTGAVGNTAAVYKCAHICKIIAYGGVCPSADASKSLGGSSYRWSNVHTVCTTTGAVIESNLCTPGIDSCPQGSVVVWRDGKLQGTTQEYDYNVMGVTAPDTESPIVMGAEPILVTGDIQEGDPIVTSSKINHGMKGDRACDLHGKVIAQALESGSGESYMIQGMIRKF